MGFGSYDESDQNQAQEANEDNGESVEKHAKDGKYEGKDSIEDESVDDMLKHL